MVNFEYHFCVTNGAKLNNQINGRNSMEIVKLLSITIFHIEDDINILRCLPARKRIIEHVEHN
jgi:hypothetical protein